MIKISTQKVGTTTIKATKTHSTQPSAIVAARGHFGWFFSRRWVDIHSRQSAKRHQRGVRLISEACFGWPLWGGVHGSATPGGFSWAGIPALFRWSNICLATIERRWTPLHKAHYLKNLESPAQVKTRQARDARHTSHAGHQAAAGTANCQRRLTGFALVMIDLPEDACRECQRVIVAHCYWWALKRIGHVRKRWQNLSGVDGGAHYAPAQWRQIFRRPH